VLDGLPVKLIFLKDLSVEDGDFEEHGETFADNAFLKAAYYSAKTGLPTIGEDSGDFDRRFSGRARRED
jgi:inosine/xanthosine triphosphate pyrophosphatase family protein